MTARLRAVRASLPRGGGLPEELWLGRHRGIVALLWAHSVAIPIFAFIRGFHLDHVVVESAIVPAAAIVASSPGIPRRVRVAAASIGLLSSSAILVHLSGGLIEMHFHFFVMVAVVALYQDWLPFLASIAYVLVHHGLLGALDPMSVYNHPAAWNNPWKWAAIHAFFVAGISAACLVTWRLNEIILAQRRRAEDRLRDESRVVATLNDVGQSLAAEHDIETVVQQVTDAATSLTPAAFGAFFYNVRTTSGESYMLHTLSGAPAEAFSGFPMPRNTALFSPTFAGEGVVRLDDVANDSRYGKNAPYWGMPDGHLPVRSYLAAPVRSRTGEILGGLFFGHPEPGRFTETDERLVVGIAAHAAVALDNARLYESERRARQTAEDAQRHLEVLAEASRALSSSLELSEILSRLVRAVSPAIADACAIYAAGDDGVIHQLAAHGAPAVPPLAAATVPFAERGHPVARVIATGEPAMFPDGPAGADHVGAPALAGWGPATPGAAIIVPVMGRGRAIGALFLANRDGAQRMLEQTDITLAEEVARRAAVAIENARLYAAQRGVAETLQQSLLPERLPDIPGLTIASRYLPGGPGIEVGGDWYDVFVLPTGSVALVMGDVVGHGVPAASLMGQLRNALRAYALEDERPATVVSRLNDLLTEFGTGSQMATLLYAVYDPDSGSVRLTNAGHPPPLIATADGSATFVEGMTCVPLGATARGRFSETTIALPPGAVFLMYTDGLVERRDRPLDTGLEILRGAVPHGPPLLEDLCDYLIRQTLGGRENRDDVALLAVRAIPLGSRVTFDLPTTPAVLRPLRATLRRWLANAGVPDQDAFEILTAAGEACANAVQHGGLTAATFSVQAEVDEEVRITVSDKGGWRESPAGGGGYGLGIMEQFMDDVEVAKASEGTRVALRRRWRSAAKEPSPA